MDARARRTPPWLLPLAAAASAAALVAWVFAPAAGHGFVALGDDWLLGAHDRWHGFGDGRLRWMLGAVRGGAYRPVAWLSLALDHVLDPADPARAVHRTNLILHALTAGLAVAAGLGLASARRRTSGAAERGGPPTAAAALGAAILLWALHPLRVEPTAWASARGLVLASALLAAAAALLVRGTGGRSPRTGAVAGAAALAALAGLAHPPAAFAAVGLSAIPAWLRAHCPDSAAAAATGGTLRRWHAWLWVPAAILATLAFGVRGPAADGEFLRDLLAASDAAIRPLRDTVWPAALAPAQGPPDGFERTIPPRLWTSLALVLLLAVGLATGLRARRGLAMAAGASAVALTGAILLGREPFGADRHAHLATLPLFVAAGVGAAGLGPALRVAFFVAAAATAAFLGLRSRALLPAWAETERLRDLVVRADPSNEWALWLRGEEARRAGRTPEEVLAWHRRSLEHGGARPLAEGGAGAALADLGRRREAETRLRRSVRLAPWRPAPRRALGALLLERGQVDEAVVELEAAVRLDDLDPSAWYTLGRARSLAGDRAGAARALERAVELAPGDRLAAEELGRLAD